MLTSIVVRLFTKKPQTSSVRLNLRPWQALSRTHAGDQEPQSKRVPCKGSDTEADNVGDEGGGVKPSCAYRPRNLLLLQREKLADHGRLLRPQSRQLTGEAYWPLRRPTGQPQSQPCRVGRGQAAHKEGADRRDAKPRLVKTIKEEDNLVITGRCTRPHAIDEDVLAELPRVVKRPEVDPQAPRMGFTRPLILGLQQGGLPDPGLTEDDDATHRLKLPNQIHRRILGREQAAGRDDKPVIVKHRWLVNRRPKARLRRGLIVLDGCQTMNGDTSDMYWCAADIRRVSMNLNRRRRTLRGGYLMRATIIMPASRRSLSAMNEGRARYFQTEMETCGR